MLKSCSFINILFSSNDVIESSTFQIGHSREPINGATPYIEFQFQHMGSLKHINERIKAVDDNKSLNEVHGNEHI